MNTLDKLPIDLVRQVVNFVPRNYVVEYDTDIVEDCQFSLYFTDFIQEISKEITRGYDTQEIFDKVKKFIDLYIINVDWFCPKYMLEDDEDYFDPDERIEGLCYMLEDTFDGREEFYDEFKSEECNPWFYELDPEDLPNEIGDSFFNLFDGQRIIMLKFCLYSLVRIVERYD